MAHAEKCPICEGTGTLELEAGAIRNSRPCHGCDGKGWVGVSDTLPEARSVGSGSSCYYNMMVDR